MFYFYFAEILLMGKNLPAKLLEQVLFYEYRRVMSRLSQSLG